ncbi:MAG: DUF2934 domain-containing protein [Candidatus Binataceae bacterium]
MEESAAELETTTAERIAKPARKTKAAGSTKPAEPKVSIPEPTVVPTHVDVVEASVVSPIAISPAACEGTSKKSSAREEIERRAYEIFVARGYAHGSDVQDWLQAERECIRTAKES